MRELIAQGAEAKIYADGERVVKERFSKNYRIPEIDNKLRKSRTKREAKILTKLSEAGFPAPKLIFTDEKSIVEMSRIEGNKLRDVFETSDTISLAKEIGRKVATLHNLHIIHGDLTTSNMLLSDEIYFIDFGLSFFSYKPEDMAVDIHLLRQALESKHYKVWESAFEVLLSEYEKTAEEGSIVVKRLEKVEKRGRYKRHKGRVQNGTKEP